MAGSIQHWWILREINQSLCHHRSSCNEQYLPCSLSCFHWEWPYTALCRWNLQKNQKKQHNFEFSSTPSLLCTYRSSASLWLVTGKWLHCRPQSHCCQPYPPCSHHTTAYYSVEGRVVVVIWQCIRSCDSHVTYCSIYGQFGAINVWLTLKIPIRNDTKVKWLRNHFNMNLESGDEEVQWSLD